MSVFVCVWWIDLIASSLFIQFVYVRLKVYALPLYLCVCMRAKLKSTQHNAVAQQLGIPSDRWLGCSGPNMHKMKREKCVVADDRHSFFFYLEYLLCVPVCMYSSLVLSSLFCASFFVRRWFFFIVDFVYCLFIFSSHLLHMQTHSKHLKPSSCFFLMIIVLKVAY